MRIPGAAAHGNRSGTTRQRVRHGCDHHCAQRFIQSIYEVHNPSGLPGPNELDYIEEPYIIAQIISKSAFLGAVMNLCIEKRGILKNQVYLTSERVEVTFEMPLAEIVAEIVFDFYDKLKSISRGYASFDYHFQGIRQPSWSGSTFCSMAFQHSSTRTMPTTSAAGCAKN